MKKTLVTLVALGALMLGAQAFAACPCETQKPCDDPCKSPCEKPCEKQKPCDPCDTAGPCGENWLSCTNLEEYFCKIGLDSCQKQKAMQAIEEFKADTACFRMKGCDCETKCECRTYRHALKDLDCKMKKIITDCQKENYEQVRDEVKDQVKCAHKCLINPFSRCKCGCNE